MKIQFVSEGPALLVRNKERILVAADLHIGIEADLAAHGWHVASRTNDRLLRLLSCVESESPDRVVLLGDVKHNLPRTTRQEYFELPGFLSAIRKTVPFHVVPGNHDTGIARFLQEGELLAKNGAVLDGFGYLHGHTLPSPDLAGRLIITGHHHPLVSIYDDVGCALKTPAYLLAGLNDSLLFRETGKGLKQGQKQRRKGGGTRALFMPAFNECAGFDIVSIIQHPFSPISRSIIAGSAEVLLSDGTYIGPVSSMEEPDAAA
ncbi:MAG: Calcineurin-like phosphoesterase [Methanoregula sp. PtaU1.Bin051]|nr:MAG: Calcineurin-like phosphoesterase [Methanoregula sp. PtaU1.Bin051]